ncbi:MAG: efflux RND transporter periplasmic adaptor subunit, partial [SAR324 cluster bacterium]|nr:efflux RND transporter periplasmic adaptor subunit [SAR324 cluster bacterium]
IAVENAQNAVLRSEQDHEGAKIALENSKITLMKTEQDVEGGKLALENAKLALLRSEQELVRVELAEENAKFSVKLSEQEVILRQDTLEDTIISSKISGIVIKKYFEEGEVVANGARLFDIINIDRVEIVVGVEEEDLSRIQIGQKVVFTTPAYPNRRFAGEVVRLSWTTNNQNGEFPVFVHAENPNLMLRSGMSTKVYRVSSE